MLWPHGSAERISIHVPLAGNVHPRYGQTWPCLDNFYPRSPCGERQPVKLLTSTVTMISIHVPLAGNVPAIAICLLTCSAFLSTFPLRGTSGTASAKRRRQSLFLSTFPLRGTSLPRRYCRSLLSHFYPRSPCGERLGSGVSVAENAVISIHVPLAGNVACRCSSMKHKRAISIHVPLAGNVSFSPPHSSNFTFSISIHVPLAGNVLPSFSASLPQFKFLSTFPLRGTSAGLDDDVTRIGISIHVPLAGNVRILLMG